MATAKGIGAWLRKMVRQPQREDLVCVCVGGGEKEQAWAISENSMATCGNVPILGFGYVKYSVQFDICSVWWVVVSVALWIQRGETN